MSSGPTMTGNDDRPWAERYQGYVSLQLTCKDWCTWPGKCKKDRVTRIGHELCLLCKYRKPLDIPRRIEQAWEDQK